LNRLRGRPAYQQIADDIRSRILDGTLSEGDKLPSEAELMSDYGVSRIVVRMAVEILESEGLVTKRQGKGTFVRALKPLHRRIVGDLYSERPGSSPVSASARAAGRIPDYEHATRRTTATKAVAARLKIKPGSPIMRTNYVFLADELPIMLSTSYEPLVLTKGTPIEQPEASPTTGVVARMDLIGQHITHVTEEVTARAPRPYELDALNMAPGVAVLAIERTYYVEDRPVETADVIVPADRYTLHYRIPIPP
jgi:DNA-binding GntR family transcriptional regulator